MNKNVSIVGAGAIGVAIAAVFVEGGFPVTIVDRDSSACADAPAEIARHQKAIARAGLASDTASGTLRCGTDLANVAASGLVIEAAAEDRDLKAALFRELLRVTGRSAILISTSSAIPISSILPEAGDQRRCLVAHPANPPSLIRVLELVPAHGTAPETISEASRIFSIAGFDPIPLGHEIRGFVFNRLQSALLREAYRLVDEKVIDVDGLDRLVRDGLGPRWALSGPFETADLNTAGGIRAHAARMGPAYTAIGAERGETNPRWSDALVDRVTEERRMLLPEEDLPARRAWRETALADLLAARRSLFAEAEE
ncbi:MAG: 3-hydroxyacyl-CoA dehydrogenase NAD-binding domain-containing protein [Pseudomonadota bacterium]